MEQRYMEVLLEDIRSKFDLVLEGHAVLHSAICATREDLGAKIEQNSFEIQVLNQKIDTVEQRLDAKIDSVEKKLTERIDNVEQKLTERIDAVEQRLTESIDSIEQNLAAVAADLTAHRHDTERHNGYRVSE